MATGGDSYSRDQIPKLQQRGDSNLRRAECKLRAFRTQHPSGNRDGRTVSELTNHAFAMCPFLALTNLQGLAEQRVPTVKNRDGLETRGTM
jgi:hypothetical protein